MIEALGQKLYSSQEICLLLGVGKDTLVSYARRAKLPRRIIQRVRYYTEADLRKMLQIPNRRKEQ